MGVIREERKAIGPRPVGVVRADTGRVEKYSRIAEAQSQLTSLAIEELGKTAVKEGEAAAQAVSVDQITSINPATGKPEALDFMRKNAFVGRKGQEAFERVLAERFQIEIENDIKQRAGEIALKFENDPYSVEKYEDQMNAYLKELAANSEENGNPTAYTNFIATQGAQYITATSLSMMQERQRRERAKVAQAHINENLAKTNAAYELGNGLNFKNFDLLLKSSVERNVDLEDSNLFQSGSAVAHGSELRQQFVNGVVEQMLNSGTPLQRAKLIDALQRSNTGRLHAGSRETVQKLLKYVDSTNKAAILSNAKQVNATLQGIQAAQDAYDADILRQSKIGMLDGFINDGDAFAGTTFNAITGAYNEGNFGKLELVVKDSVQSAVDRLTQIDNASDELMTADQKRVLREGTRRSLIEPLLAIAARSDPNNISDLSLAITRNDDVALGRLNEFQASIVEGLRSEEFPMERSDVGFIASFLAGSVNEVQVRVDNYFEKSKFDDGVTQFIKNTKAGIENEKDINTLVDEINSSKRHTDPEKDALKERLRLGYAYTAMNGFDQPTSISLNALQQYLATEGREDLGLTEVQKITANEILSFMTDQNGTKILGEVGTRQANARTQEVADEAAAAAYEKYRKLDISARSGGTLKTKEHREHVDTILRDAGIDILDPSSESSATYRYLRNTMSQQLLNSLNAFAGGTQTFNDQTANTLLNHFERLSRDPDRAGMINRFGSMLGENYGFLEDLVAIRNLATGSSEPISVIASKLRNEASTPAADLAYKNTLGPSKVEGSGNTPAYDFAYGLVEDKRVALELEPIVAYYARTSRNAEEITSLVNNILEMNYGDSEYVVDPSMPPKMMGKTRASLSIIYPDQEERDAFVSIVNEQLPAGYVLGSIGKPLPEVRSEKTDVYADAQKYMAGSLMRVSAGEDPDINNQLTKVFLVPYGFTNEVQYYIYEQDKRTMELRPLIYERATYNPATSQVENELTWPMFDSTTTDSWRAEKRARDLAAAELKVERNRALGDAVRESSSRRGYQGTPTLSPLAQDMLGLNE